MSNILAWLEKYGPWLIVIFALWYIGTHVIITEVCN